MCRLNSGPIDVKLCDIAFTMVCAQR